MEDRPGAAFQRRGEAVPFPVAGALARERGDAEARQRDFDHPGDERAAGGGGGQPVAPEGGLDVADGEVGVEEGVEDGEDAEDGEGDADVGYYVGGGGHCGRGLFFFFGRRGIGLIARGSLVWDGVASAIKWILTC